jgi:hypothetical protein
MKSAQNELLPDCEHDEHENQQAGAIGGAGSGDIFQDLAASS